MKGDYIMTTIGELIGIVEDNFEVTNSAGDKVQLRVKFDFTRVFDSDIKSWLCGNRRIAFQRPARSLSASELRDLDGTLINANECGRKVQSRDEKIQMLKTVFINAGVSEVQASELAIAAVDNPVLLTIKKTETSEDESEV